MKIFEKIKVIELASVLAGPAVGMFFAELGAQVVKVENKKTGGDVTRSWKLPSEHKDSTTSAYFHSVNFGKTHLFKDLSDKKEKDQVYELISNADILISNFKKGSAEKLGFDFRTIRNLNEQIVHCNLVGFEEQNKTAYDVVLQAETSWLNMTGNEEQRSKIPVAMIDLMAAHQMKEAILIGLLERKVSGKGKSFEVSLEKSSLSSLANLASNYLNTNSLPKRLGTLHPNIAPYGEIFTTKDGVDFVFAIGSDIQFQCLCEEFDDDNLINKDRFNSNQKRLKNRKELGSILSILVASIHSADLESTCLKRKIPIGRLKELNEVLASPAAKKMILKDAQESMRLSSIAFQEIQY
ncbi:MAG: CaiB/BaiF CoA-transferase family protein [Bacteroidota bacterium]